MTLAVPGEGSEAHLADKGDRSIIETSVFLSECVFGEALSDREEWLDMFQTPHFGVPSASGLPAAVQLPPVAGNAPLAPAAPQLAAAAQIVPPQQPLQGVPDFWTRIKHAQDELRRQSLPDRSHQVRVLGMALSAEILLVPSSGWREEDGSRFAASAAMFRKILAELPEKSASPSEWAGPAAAAYNTQLGNLHELVEAMAGADDAVHRALKRYNDANTDFRTVLSTCLGVQVAAIYPALLLANAVAPAPPISSYKFQWVVVGATLVAIMLPTLTYLLTESTAAASDVGDAIAKYHKIFARQTPKGIDVQVQASTAASTGLANGLGEGGRIAGGATPLVVSHEYLDKLAAAQDDLIGQIKAALDKTGNISQDVQSAYSAFGWAVIGAVGEAGQARDEAGIELVRAASQQTANLRRAAEAYDRTDSQQAEALSSDYERAPGAAVEASSDGAGEPGSILHGVMSAGLTTPTASSWAQSLDGAPPSSSRVGLVEPESAG